MNHKEEKSTTVLVDVYIAELPVHAPLGEVANATRREEIESAKSEGVKREKYFVWRLLAYALSHSLGLTLDSLDIRRASYGGWSLDGISLSLSHSKNALAVALSHEAVGVDIEHIHTPRARGIAERVMSEEELSAYHALPEEERTQRFIEIWTAKEALFKSQGEPLFLPHKINTVGASVRTLHLEISGEDYILSVASEHLASLRLVTGVDLTE